MANLKCADCDTYFPTLSELSVHALQHTKRYFVDSFDGRTWFVEDRITKGRFLQNNRFMALLAASRMNRVVSAKESDMNIEKYVEENWPSDVPKDCTNLDENERDCMDLGKPANEWCHSCLTYDRIYADGERLQEIMEATLTPDAQDAV